MGFQLGAIKVRCIYTLCFRLYLLMSMEDFNFWKMATENRIVYLCVS